jgi:hypothetical protein
MRISIALATYNGGRFLPEQLESLKNQVRPPDELVVVDDASTDNTAEIIKEFGKDVPFPVRLEVSSENQGPVRSFELALRRCQGDTILLCDQDDIWHPGKVERFETIFAENPEAEFAFSNAALINGEGQALPGDLWQEKSFGPVEQAAFASGQAFPILLQRSTITGCTLALRHRDLSIVLPIPADGPLLHDAWISLLLSAFSTPVLIHDPLVQYRHHPQQFTEVLAPRPGETAQVRIQQMKGHLEQLRQARERLLESSVGAGPAPRNLELLAGKIRHLERRSQLPPCSLPRALAVLSELLSGGYARHSNGLRSAFLDVYSGRVP